MGHSSTLSCSTGAEILQAGFLCCLLALGALEGTRVTWGGRTTSFSGLHLSLQSPFLSQHCCSFRIETEFICHSSSLRMILWLFLKNMTQANWERSSYRSGPESCGASCLSGLQTPTVVDCCLLFTRYTGTCLVSCYWDKIPDIHK